MLFWIFITRETKNILPPSCHLTWIIETINANMFSFQDDYIKNTEENTGSDESKSGRNYFDWLERIFLCLCGFIWSVSHLKPECVL